MRINYYVFPDDAPEPVMLSEGCAVVLKSGSEIYPSSIPEEKRHLVDHIDHTVGGISITRVKTLMRLYGGYGYTEHCERDGGVFEVTPINLKGNNSRFKYNHHL